MSPISWKILIPIFVDFERMRPIIKKEVRQTDALLGYGFMFCLLQQPLQCRNDVDGLSLNYDIACLCEGYKCQMVAGMCIGSLNK